MRLESTWRGLLLIATASGAYLNPEQSKIIMEFGIGIAGVMLTARNR